MCVENLIAERHGNDGKRIDRYCSITYDKRHTIETIEAVGCYNDHVIRKRQSELLCDFDISAENRVRKRRGEGSL